MDFIMDWLWHLRGNKHQYLLIISFHGIFRERAEKKKRGEDDDDGEQNIQTALDVEDAWEHELQEFKPTSRITGTFGIACVYWERM
jgi:hypothetical protein